MAEPSQAAPTGERVVVGQLTKQERTPQGGFDLYESGVLPDIFADGVTQVMFGGVMARLLLHRVEGTYVEGGTTIEQRRPVISLAIPTTALLQMCVSVLQQTQMNAGALIENLEETKRVITQTAEDQIRADVSQRIQKSSA